MREDWVAHDRKLSVPGLHAVLVQRLGAWRLTMPRGPIRYGIALVHLVLHVLVRNVYGIEIFYGTRLGRRVVIVHQSGIVIDDDAEIGDDSVIRQNVTIGRAVPNGPAPRLGRSVEVGAGAAIIGGVTVGDGAKIGPNAVVVSDVAPGATAFASPARQMQPKGQRAESDRKPER